MRPVKKPMEREESFVLCEIDDQSKFDAWNRPLKAGTHGTTQRGGMGREEGATHVHPWLIRVNVWQKPPEYCKVISLQLK